MKQKAFFYLSILLFGFAAISVQAQSNTLNIIQWSGEESNVGISSVDKITFIDNDLIVNYNDGNNESIDILSIRKITVSSNPSSNINIVSTNDKISASIVSGSHLIIHNMPEGSHTISIYSISGSLLKNEIVNSDSPIIDISSIGEGIYILLVNNQSLKFLKP